MSGELSRRIALFGGTFDPIHDGHIAVAAAARERMALDEVVFLPCHTSPHKLQGQTAPPQDRLEMVRLATADLPWAVVDDFDLTRPPPSYSFETAEEMQRRWPGARLFWIMGADQWRALPLWKEPGRLAGLVEFIVVSRDGTPEPREGFTLHSVAGVHPASSTGIRLAVAAGAPPPWLHPSVAEWIDRQGLYKIAPAL